MIFQYFHVCTIMIDKLIIMLTSWQDMQEWYTIYKKLHCIQK